MLYCRPTDHEPVGAFWCWGAPAKTMTLACTRRRIDFRSYNSGLAFSLAGSDAGIVKHLKTQPMSALPSMATSSPALTPGTSTRHCAIHAYEAGIANFPTLFRDCITIILDRLWRGTSTTSITAKACTAIVSVRSTTPSTVVRFCPDSAEQHKARATAKRLAKSSWHGSKDLALLSPARPSSSSAINHKWASPAPAAARQAQLKTAERTQLKQHSADICTTTTSENQ